MNKVTCLCLTRNRRQWLPQAIACFLQQTYPNRELLVVSDGEPVGDLIPNVPGLIRHVAVGDRTVVGNKRNIGCFLSDADLIAVWDDDDFSAPERLERQVERLEISGKAVTGYRTLPFTDGRSWWLYQGTADFAVATSLVFRRGWWEGHRFAAQQVGQDEAFAAEAARERQLVTVDDEGLMAASIHAGNTSPRSSLGRSSSWKAIEPRPEIQGWSFLQEAVACSV